VTGTWSVSSSCLSISGKLDVSLIGMTCPPPAVTGSLKVTGTFTANSNGSYADGTTATGSESFSLDASCLVISSTPTTCSGAANVLLAMGYSSVTCQSVSGGGCACTATVQQTGGLGLVSPLASNSGSLSTSGNVLTIDDTLKYSYCASGNSLTLTPQSTSVTTTGTIVLQKNGSSPGSGGAPGSGGQPGTGGSLGAGGQNIAGGAPASGGAGVGGGPVTGGTRSAGGGSATGGTRSATGGSTVAGGATASGGATTVGTGVGGAPVTGGATGVGGTTAVAGSSSSGPCDIYAAGNTPCVAAHSMVRALYGTYSGKLYQVRRSDNTTKDILTLAAGGIADTAPHDTFCAGSSCVVTVVYDQSGKGNDLWYQGSTEVPASTSSSAAKATDTVTVGGHKVYSLYINPGNCYWHDGSKSGMATGSQPEGMYMVTSSRHANSGCCFDYGNSETTRSADVGGAMDAINISTTTAWGSGAGNGPWIMADLEWGLFAQGNNSKNNNDPTQTAAFVTAVMRNNGTTEYAIRGGDASSGALTTYYKGSIPYNPMKKQGALILGCGGDCCKPSGGANASSGIFFEGAIVTSYPTDATENAVQANIVAAGYGK